MCRWESEHTADEREAGNLHPLLRTTECRWMEGDAPHMGSRESVLGDHRAGIELEIRFAFQRKDVLFRGDADWRGFSVLPVWLCLLQCTSMLPYLRNFCAKQCASIIPATDHHSHQYLQIKPLFFYMINIRSLQSEITIIYLSFILNHHSLSFAILLPFILGYFWPCSCFPWNLLYCTSTFVHSFFPLLLPHHHLSLLCYMMEGGDPSIIYVYPPPSLPFCVRVISQAGEEVG